MNNASRIQPANYFEISQNGYESAIKKEGAIQFQNRKRNPNDSNSEERDNENFMTPFQDYKYKKDQRSNILNNFEEESTIKQSLSGLKQTTAIRGSQNFNKTKAECKSLRLLGNISSVNPIYTNTQNNKSYFQQKNSFPKHNNLKNTFGFNKSVLQNKNGQISPTFFNPEKTNVYDEFYQRDLNIAQIIDSCSFEQKQKALKLSSDLVEKIAAKQANIQINNISNQYGGQNYLSKEIIQDIEICEFDPIQFQAYSQSPIPDEIQKIIYQQKIEIFNGQNQSKKSIVERINQFQNIGSIVDGYFYAINQTETENCLYLWKVNEKSLNEQKIGKLNLNSDQNLSVNKIRFEYPIQSVCYVESHSENFKPMLIVATSQEIQLRTFIKRPESQNFMANANQFKIEREAYDLLYLENNQFEPIILDLGEEISKIIQMKKTGKIFYSSHKNSYNQVFIKELKLPQQYQQKIQNTKNDGKLEFSIQNMIMIQSSRLGQSVKLIGQSFVTQNKRIQSVKAQDRSNIFVNALKQIVPNFLNFTIQMKCILDIQIDEQRNILYSLTNKIKQKSMNSKDLNLLRDQNISSNWLSSSGNFDAFAQSVIEVYDLGILCNDFNKVCEIDQERLFNIAMESFGLRFQKSDKLQHKRIFDQFRIVSVHPITISQSSDRQLLIQVVNGTRFFISFQQQPLKNSPYEKEIEQNELQFDSLQSQRICQQWNVVSMNFLPSLEEAILQYNQNPNPFKQLQLQKQNYFNVNKQNDQHSYFNEILPFADEYLIKPRPVYCNQLSCFVYSEIRQLQPRFNQDQFEMDEESEQTKFLNISFLSKNEPSYCYSRKIDLEDYLPNINETYSAIQIQSLESAYRKNFGQDQNNYRELIEESIPDEFIIQISAPSNHGFLTGPIDKQININEQRMIGANQALKLNQGWGVNNGLQYMPINEMEKQVYEAFDLKTFKVLTNQRLISLVVMRPIDQLLGILEQIQNSANGAYDLELFNSFIMKYSIEEVCCMLIQIISEKHQFKFISSKKSNKEIQQHQVNFRSIKLNEDHNQGKSFSKQPRQMTNISKSNIGSKISFLASHQSKFSPFGTTGFKNERSQRATSLFRGQNQFLSQIDERQQNDLNQLSFVYLNYPQENNKYQLKSEIDNNCIYKSITNQQQKLIQIASELLQIYGDSTKKSSHDFIIETYRGKKFLKQNSINQELTSITISSLFTYIQRVLRPIWDINITMMKRSTEIFEQECNTQMFFPALQKLQNILLLLQNQNLFKQQTIQDQARILAQDINILDQKDIGINHKGLLSEIEFVFNFDSITKENIDIHKNKILKNLTIFVKRCIDVIEFLKIVTFQQVNDEDQNQKDLFNKMLKQIGKQSDGKNLLKEIQTTQYKDLVKYGGCNQFMFQDKNIMNNIYGQLNIQKIDAEKFNVVKVLYENCLQIKIEMDRQLEKNIIFDYHKIYNSKAETIQRICPTLFSVNQTQTFIGECILQHSLQEKDRAKQDQIVEQGLRQLKTAPLDINLDTVVPTLCKIGRMIEIADIVMEKISKLNESMERKRNESINSSIYTDSIKQSEYVLPIDSQYEQLFQCFELIVGLYRSLDDHLFESNKQKYVKKQDRFIRSVLDLKSQEKIYNEMKKHRTQEMKWYDIFYKQFNESSFNSQSNQAKFQLRTDIIKCIQAYEDKYLLKFLFEYIVYQPRENLKYHNLPKLDFLSFKEVYQHITSEWQLSKESIEILINHLCRYQNFQEQVQKNEFSELYIKEELSKMLCSFVLRLFEEKGIKITSSHIESKQIQQNYLNCETKIKYCQLAIDSINSVEHESNQQIASQYLPKMQIFLETFFFEKKVIQSLQSKYDRLKEYQKRLDYNSDLQNELTQTKNNLFKVKNTVESLNYNQQDLYEQIVVNYSLYDLIYEYQYQKMKFHINQVQYQHENEQIKDIAENVIYFFKQSVDEIVQYSNVKSAQSISKKIKPYTWIEVFKEIFKVHNILTKFFNIQPEICKQSYMIILKTYLQESERNQNKIESQQEENEFSILSNQLKRLYIEQFENIQEFYIVGCIIDTFQKRPYTKINVSEFYKTMHAELKIQQDPNEQTFASFESNRNLCQVLAFIYFWTKKNPIEIQQSHISISNIQIRGYSQGNNYLNDLKASLPNLTQFLEKINANFKNENFQLLIPKDYQETVVQIVENIISENQKNLKD